MNNFIFLVCFLLQMLVSDTVLAKNINFFDANQLASLQLISTQCPDVLGNIVYQARSMYTYVADVDMLSKAGCANANNMEIQSTNIENISEMDSKIVLYPNPAQTEINLYLVGFENIETKISIINMLGEKVLQIHNNIQNTMQINVNHLPAGVYVCQIKGNNIVVTKNFVITK